jgi:hypothetical protein
VICKVTDPLLPALEPTKLYPGDELRLAIHTTVPLTASGSLVNDVTVEGGGAEAASAEIHSKAGGEETSAGLEEFHADLTGPDGLPSTGADSHPYQYTTSFAVNTVPAPPGSGQPFLPAQGDLKEVEVALPPGLVGNPTQSERCSAQQFNSLHSVLVEGSDVSENECPDGSAVGLAVVQQFEGVGGRIPAPIYNLIPPAGMPAQFGFQPTLGLPVYIDTKLRSESDYGITAYVHDIPQAKRITATRVTFWGTPADPSHDPLRGQCVVEESGDCSAGAAEGSFLRLPSSCASPLETTMSFDTWLHPGAFVSSPFGESAPTGCDQPDFSPSIEASPRTAVADSPTGLHVDLHLPQKQHEEPKGLGEADLRDTRVTLPEGLLVNPASADGLAGCSEAQIGYQGVKEGRQSFSAIPAECPDASKIGKVEVDTPLLDHALPGAVYLASPFENPFGSLLAIYIAVYDPVSGVVVKLPGHVEPNPVTGQLTTTVIASPQVPFEDFKLDFFEGPRASLRTPATCGPHTTTTSLTPWSSPQGATVTPSASFQITSAPGDDACPSTPADEPNAPSFEAGPGNAVAGTFSPLVVHVGRGDDSQYFGSVSVTLPPGATGKLADIPECSEAQIAVAQARSNPGEGAAEAASPACPASSAIGTVTVGAGAGPSPFYVTGQAYLAGPYRGAPFSAVFITPAIAGPFDLGVVVVRAGLYVDPSTAQVTTKSDPLPSILQGIPLDIRSLTVAVDRPGFTLNPTNCEPLTVVGEEVSTLGRVASLSDRFQVGGCQSLSFKPTFTASTQGRASKANGASLTVKVSQKPGEANIRKVNLALPVVLPSRLSTLQKACTEAQFNVNPAGCPEGSFIGTARASTPLLATPLTGPAILVSHGGAAFPDVEFLLQAEGVHITLDGKTDIKKGVTYSKFETVPDDPITSFETILPQGPHSVLGAFVPAKANYNFCTYTKPSIVKKKLTIHSHGHTRHITKTIKKSAAGQLLMPTTITGQNGAVVTQTTKIAITGCPKAKPTKASKMKRKDKKR